MIITFCGHSYFCKTKEDEQKILDIFEKEIGNNSAELYLGDYGSFDTFAYQCGKKYKEKHPNLKLVFVTPYMTVNYQKNHLNGQKTRFDSVVYPDIEKTPPKFAIIHRNRWMIEKADLVIAYIRYESGGAYQTYKYAKRKNKVIFNLAEKEL